MSKDEHSTHDERMDAAMREMEIESPTDPTATTPQYQAELGRSTTHGSTFARVDGVTTSPKLSRHDVPYNRLRNTFNNLESDEVEELLEHCYGKSVYQAAAENFVTFDPSKLKEILSMSEEEVEALLDGDEDDEDVEEDE